jgi:ABC-2 type transport system ATP-binding protein
MSALLRVDGLRVEAAGRAIVDDVSFDLSPGEIVALIGPNGAGKTTLLEGVLGLRPASGRVSLNGDLLTTFRQRARTFAFVPDDATPPGEVLVSTLVRHADACRARDAATRASLLRDLALERLLDRSAAMLSRGERKRVGLYVALVLERPVLVLDEPFGVFDPLQLASVLDAVRSVARAGSAILVSVHQLRDAERIADRVLLLADGHRLAFGPVSDVRGSAATLEEAFIDLLSRRADAS